ncbi:MAG: efflux transporter outer membrane subunit [Betaproteobacteria bacterium]|nr:MAG: efflux transporter outer membrane subunit [Betaproteobacteria bacterium]
MPKDPNHRCLQRVRWIAWTAVALAGCSVGPNYVRPVAEAPPAYKEAQGWKVAEPKDQQPRGNWWEVFNDPQLSSLLTQVEISNQTLKAAEARVREARALTQAARAAFFPVVTANASASRSGSGSGAARVGSAGGQGSGGGGVGNSYNLALDVNWEVDLWGRIRRTVEASEATAQASAADLEAAKLSAQATLAEDYFLLRVQDAQIRLLNDTVAAYEKSLQLTRNQYAVGVVGRVDVAQAETQLSSTRAQAIDAAIQRAQLEHAIAVLVGKPPAEFSVAVADVPAGFPDIPPGIPSELLERRPDIAAAERRAAAANAQIGVAEAAFFPSLTLSATGGFQSSLLSHLISLPSRYWSIGTALAQTIFDAGLRRAQTAQAIATYDENVANYRQTVLAGFQEVEDNLAALRILEQEAVVQDDAVKSARESVTITLNQYRAGTANYLAVVVVQATALANERAALAILGRRLDASVALIKALGGSWDAAAL